MIVGIQNPSDPGVPIGRNILLKFCGSGLLFHTYLIPIVRLSPNFFSNIYIRFYR
jgi:hypothetical protein